MHEASLVQALFDEVERVLAPHSGASVRALHVRIGELAGVEPELFRSAYEVLRMESRLASAELALSIEPCVWSCTTCRTDLVRGQALVCPRCGAAATLRTGGAVILERVEAEVEHV